MSVSVQAPSAAENPYKPVVKKEKDIIAEAEKLLYRTFETSMAAGAVASIGGGDNGGGGSSQIQSALDNMMKVSMMKSQKANTDAIKDMSRNSTIQTQLTAAHTLKPGDFVSVETDQIAVNNNGCDQTVSFELPNGVKKSTFKIVNAQGRVVRRIEGPKTPGPHAMPFDGKDPGGKFLTPGVYSVAIEADTGNVNPTMVNTTVTGTLDKVTNKQGHLTIHMGHMEVGFDQFVSMMSQEEALHQQNQQLAGAMNQVGMNADDIRELVPGGEQLLAAMNHNVPINERLPAEGVAN